MNTQSYIQTNIQSIHSEWVATLRDIRQVSDPAARSMYLEHMEDLYDRALTFKDEVGLNTIEHGAIMHILGRPIKDHLTTIKAVTSKNIL